jgi:hypothetical protein
LLNALYSHTFLVWKNKPAHMYYLQSVVMDYLKEWPKRLKLLQQSLTLTSPTNHEFLTKVQSLWSDLLDLGDYQKAESFLLEVYRFALRDDLPEVQEMFHATSRALAHSTSRDPGGPAGRRER